MQTPRRTIFFSEFLVFIVNQLENRKRSKNRKRHFVYIDNPTKPCRF